MKYFLKRWQWKYEFYLENVAMEIWNISRKYSYEDMNSFLIL